MVTASLLPVEDGWHGCQADYLTQAKGNTQRHQLHNSTCTWKGQLLLIGQLRKFPQLRLDKHARRNNTVLPSQVQPTNMQLCLG